MAEPEVFEGKEPVLVSTDSSLGDKYEHEAFGIITMSNPTGGKHILFGSDLVHNQTVNIKIHRASLRRSGGRDWTYAESLPICDIEMSHAQFAQFITSSGKAEGTPVTLRYAAPVGTPMQRMAAIRKIESKNETHRKEISDTVSKTVKSLADEIAKLGALIEAGKLGKKELKQLHHTMSCIVGNLPSNMAYTVETAERALARATSDAKIEVEAYIDASARRIGYQSLQDMALALEDKTKDVK